jgi:hypothetical protein
MINTIMAGPQTIPFKAASAARRDSIMSRDYA